MFEQLGTRLHKLRVVIGGIIMVLCLTSLSMLPPVPNNSYQENRAAPSAKAVPVYDSPNAVSAGLATGLAGLGQGAKVAAGKLDRALTAAGFTLYNGFRTIGMATATGVKFTAKATAASIRFAVLIMIDNFFFIVRNIRAGVVFVGRGIAGGALFTSRSVGNAARFFTAKAPNLTAFFRPADSSSVPVIDAASLALAAQEPAKPLKIHTVSELSQYPLTTGTAWPIHGQITTLFGVPHWPFQPKHTGLDISTGQPSGVTPIRPFRAGKVQEIIYSRYGLGNHVIVDHGEGITSVYAHLASITVQAEQDVDSNTVVGYEGSTGTSTGTHLHFEIRLHGQPVDPQQYLGGRP